MVSSRYGLDSGGDDDDGDDAALTPESVPDGPIASSRSDRFQLGSDWSSGTEIAENLPFGVVLFDSEQNVVYSNPQHRELLKAGIRDSGGIEAWLKKGCRDPDYASQVVHSWREHVWRKGLTRVFSLKSADEKLREIEFRSKLLDDGGLLLTLFDVTESRRSEDALRLTETKFNTVFEHVTIGVALVDRTGRFFEVNPALERMLNFPRWELRRMALNELVPPEEFELLRKTERELMAGIGGEERTLPIHLRKKDGSILSSHVTLSPIRDGGRHPLFTAYFIRDTSDEQEIREDLRESREQNRALIEAIPDLILLMDGSGEVEDFIPPAEPWLGVEVTDEWSGKQVADLWPAFGSECLASVRKALRSGAVASFSFSELPRDGESEVHFSARIAPCGIDQVVAVITDESVEAEAREALTREGVAFRQLRDAVIVTDLRGRIQDWNPAAARIFGYSTEEITGRALAELYALPEFATEFNRHLSRDLTEAGEWRARTEFFRKDGGSGFGDVLFVPVEDEGRPRSLLGIHREIPRETIDGIAGERIQHRIRNQLQMVGSLFGLELKDPPGGSGSEGALMLQKFQARLRAVTRLNESRVRGAESGTVRLAAYARVLADDLMRICDGIGPESEVVGVFGDESVVIDLETAAPFGLLVTELGLAVFRAAAKKALIQEGGLTFVIHPDENGMTRFSADVAAEISEEVSRPILECLVSQLRGRLEMTRRDGHSSLMVCFPKIAV